MKPVFVPNGRHADRAAVQDDRWTEDPRGGKRRRRPPFRMGGGAVGVRIDHPAFSDGDDRDQPRRVR